MSAHERLAGNAATSGLIAKDSSPDKPNPMSARFTVFSESFSHGVPRNFWPAMMAPLKVVQPIALSACIAGPPPRFDPLQ